MTSNWPTSLDYNPDPDTPMSAIDRAAIKAIQVRLQRLVNAQPNAFPASGATVTPDMSQGSLIAVVIPSGVNTITIGNPINALDGDFLTVFTVQNATGVGLIAWGANFRKAAGLALSAVASAIDSFTFRYSAGAVKWNQLASILNIS